MVDSKKGFVPFRVGISLSGNQRPKTPAKIERMRGIPYASMVGSLMYAMLCTRPDICFAVGMISRYQSCWDSRLQAMHFTMYGLVICLN